MSKPKKIFISAGEVSGDRQGAALVRALKKIDPTFIFVGMGSEAMAQEGVRLVADLSPYSTIGIIEPIAYAPVILRTYFKLKKVLIEEKPDLFIAIDYQGFHMMLLKYVKTLGIKTAYYIAPQEWQWGTEEGGRGVIKLVDKILAIFPQESQFYKKLGGHAPYVGHPILDIASQTLSKETFCQQHGLDPDQPIVAIFPGSRPQELTHTAPVMLAAARLIQGQLPHVQLVLSIASGVYKARLMSMMQAAGLEGVKIVEGSSYNLIAHSTLSLCTSGTVTLEHAVLGTPCVVGYRFSPLSYWVLKTLFKKKVARIKFMSLPNLLLDREVMPEFLQDLCTAENLSEKAIGLLQDSQAYIAIKIQVQQVKELMGEPGVVERAAQEIASLL